MGGSERSERGGCINVPAWDRPQLGPGGKTQVAHRRRQEHPRQDQLDRPHHDRNGHAALAQSGRALHEADREPAQEDADRCRDQFGDAVDVRLDRLGQPAVGKARAQVAGFGGDQREAHQAGNGGGPHRQPLRTEDAVAEELTAQHVGHQRDGGDRKGQHADGGLQQPQPPQESSGSVHAPDAENRPPCPTCRRSWRIPACPSGWRPTVRPTGRRSRRPSSAGSAPPAWPIRRAGPGSAHARSRPWP